MLLNKNITLKIILINLVSFNQMEFTNYNIHSKNKNVKFEPKLAEFDLVPRNHSSN